MKAFLILAAMVITASAQAKTVSVRCVTDKEAQYEHSMSLSFDDSSEGAKRLQSLTIDKKDVTSERPNGEGVKVIGTDKMDIKIDVSLYPQYFPYDKSTFEISVGACDSRSGAGIGKYNEATYRSPLRVYDLTCTCASH